MSTKNEFIHALCKELEMRKSEAAESTIQSVYFGGGTPSLLEISEIEKILNCIRSNYNLLTDLEITVEANPDDIQSDYVKALKHLGVNRLSIGIQSFFQEDLDWMNRAHSARDSRYAIDIAQNAGIANLNIDLMYGLPDARERWRQNLNLFFNLNIPHLSAYNLTLEEHTALFHQVKHKRFHMPMEDDSLLDFNVLLDRMEEQQYEAYEISNYCRPGMRSRHNNAYWNLNPYFGFGPSAHSFDGFNKRRQNVYNNSVYNKITSHQDSALFTIEDLTNTQMFNEHIMLKLRTIDGLNFHDLELRFPSFYTNFKKQLDTLTQPQWFLPNSTNLILSREGKFLADHITMLLFA